MREGCAPLLRRNRNRLARKLWTELWTDLEMLEVDQVAPAAAPTVNP
jgi:hypothetical protein